jgi:hypothetical protein
MERPVRTPHYRHDDDKWNPLRYYSRVTHERGAVETRAVRFRKGQGRS